MLFRNRITSRCHRRHHLQRLERTDLLARHGHLITWDDWGGWYDHVPPPAFYRSADKNSCPPSIPNGWGCGYVYGFRVPLLVVSAYTPAGYVSRAISEPPTYPPPQKYTHDFDSILAVIEHNFELRPIASPYYADNNAIDWLPDRSNIPLSDFFPGPYRGLTSILADLRIRCKLLPQLLHQHWNLTAGSRW